MSDIACFLDRHQGSDDLIQLVRSGLEAGTWTVSVEASSAPCSELLSTYRIRARGLEGLSNPHPERLRLATLTLRRQLEVHRGGRAVIRSFAGPDGQMVITFEGEETRALLGCVSSYDKRKVTEERWIEIWGLRTPKG